MKNIVKLNLLLINIVMFAAASVYAGEFTLCARRDNEELSQNPPQYDSISYRVNGGEEIKFNANMPFPKIERFSNISCTKVKITPNTDSPENFKPFNVVIRVNAQATSIAAGQAYGLDTPPIYFNNFDSVKKCKILVAFRTEEEAKALYLNGFPDNMALTNSKFVDLSGIPAKLNGEDRYKGEKYFGSWTALILDNGNSGTILCPYNQQKTSGN
jgi:hypothetical protein